ncbi:MAG TPA: hypothetical protein VH880_03540 [Anaeromyxobacteraceae bacterium]|jgi:hypothetical protein
MDARVECTHCRVLMTGWTAPGSPVRYWQCPFCGRTHSSLYAEVFRSAAGARVLGRPAAAPAAALPGAGAEDPGSAAIRARAARWFARLEREGRPAPPAPPARVNYRPAPAAARLPSRQR